MLQRERADRLHIAVLNLTPLQRECLHLRAEGSSVPGDCGAAGDQLVNRHGRGTASHH